MKRKFHTGSFPLYINRQQAHASRLFYSLYILRVVSPIMFIAIFRGRIFCIINDANLLALPVMKEGRLPNFLKHSFTTSSGLSTRGVKNPVFSGCVFLKPGVAVAPAQHAITSTPLFFHSYHRLSASILLNALVAA